MAIKTEDKYTLPTFLRKLKDKIGAEGVAEEIGCSSNHVTSSINENRVVIHYELAAQLVFEKKFGDQAVGEVAIIQAAPHILKTVQALIDGVGGKFHLVP